LVTHIQDLQVDAAKDLGMIKNQKLLNMMFSMEQFLLRKSTKVSTISEGMFRKVRAKKHCSRKYFSFPKLGG